MASRLQPAFSIFTHSLGASPPHSLPTKLRAAASAGFSQVEIFQADLDHHVAASGGDGLADEVQAAREIGTLCREIGLKVLCLQPLRDLPGLRDPKERESYRQYAESRFDVMDALGTDLVLCCSSARPRAELRQYDLEDYANELGEFADAAKQRGKRVAFEALSWGTEIHLWKKAWEVVEHANRDNLGICLDSFNSLGREWADPTSDNGALTRSSARLSTLLTSLSSLPREKLFLLQIADARLLPSPLAPSPSPSEPRPARMIWSRSSRLFPCEWDRGAYLPVVEFISAVVSRVGYTGPWSLEVFNDSLSEDGEEVPERHAQRGITGLRKLVECVEAKLEAGNGPEEGKTGLQRALL